MSWTRCFYVAPSTLINTTESDTNVSAPLTVLNGMLSVASSKPNRKQRCFLFDSGQCSRGDKCRFLHITEVDNLSLDEDKNGSLKQNTVPKQLAAVEQGKPKKKSL